MDTVVTTYLIYIVLSALLTVFVGRTLSRNGELFLVDVFHGDAAVAKAVNSLLVVGFYLLNLGFVALALRVDEPVTSAQLSVEVLSTKLGAVALVLGAVHFMNLYVFTRLRSSARRTGSLGAPVAGPGNPWLAPSTEY